jgi:hypothetical protein
MTYRAPVNEMLFMMRHIGQLDRAIDGIYTDLSIDVVQNILEEAARFSQQVLAPINRSGDRHGAQFRDGVVTTAPGFKARPGSRRAGTRSAGRPNTVDRACRCCSMPAASRCGTAHASLSASPPC